MNKEEIFKIIDDKIELLNEPYAKLDEFNKVKEYTSNTPYNTFDDVLKIDIWEVVSLTLYCCNKDKRTIKDIKELIAPIKEYLDTLSLENTNIFFDNILDVMNKEEDYNDFINQINNNSYDPKIKNSIEEYKKCLDAYKNLIIIVDDYENIIDIIISGIMNFKFSINGIKYAKSLKITQETDSRELKRHLKRTLSSQISELVELDKGLELINILSKYVLNVEDKEKKYNKQRFKEISALTNIKKLLDKELKKEEIKEVRQIINGIKDEQIKKDILISIYEHNMKYYKQLEDKLSELKENDIIKYRSILKKYGIIVDDNILTCITKTSYEDL